MLCIRLRDSWKHSMAITIWCYFKERTWHTHTYTHSNPNRWNVCVCWFSIFRRMNTHTHRHTHAHNYFRNKILKNVNQINAMMCSISTNDYGYWILWNWIRGVCSVLCAFDLIFDLDFMFHRSSADWKAKIETMKILELHLKAVTKCLANPFVIYLAHCVWVY